MEEISDWQNILITLYNFLSTVEVLYVKVNEKDNYDILIEIEDKDEIYVTLLFDFLNKTKTKYEFVSKRQILIISLRRPHFVLAYLQRKRTGQIVRLLHSVPIRDFSIYNIKDKII